MPTFVKMAGADWAGELGLGDCIEIMRKNDSEVSFLKRVLTKALAKRRNYDHKLLVIVALHAVILESGFILVDKFSGIYIYIYTIAWLLIACVGN